MLRDYLEERGETATAFAKRLGVPLTTVVSWLGGTRPRSDLAFRIIQASKDQPTPTGGTVTLAALAGETEG